MPMLGDIPPADICGRRPNEHRSAYDATTCVGYSKLSDFIKCPRLFWWKHIAGAPIDTGPHLQRAFNFGTAFHSYVLENDTVSWAVKPDVDGRTTAGKEANANFKRESQGKVVISKDDEALMIRMKSALEENKLASEALFNCPHREVTYRPALGLCKLGVQGRVDAESDEPLMLDLKTCQNLDDFARNFTRSGYHRQAAFYRFLRACVTGEKVEDIRFLFVAVEKDEPHRVGVYDVGEDLLDEAVLDMRQACLRLRQALDANEWPRDDTDVQTIRRSPWK